ncbi:MAG: hypothetical protein IKU56_04015 [Clostridia bacterium]|nr:hypothetical protein [Clostridia bacterium]
MKVEVGESLMYSYLCHIKGCQIVQTNWKMSSVWPRYNVTAIENFLEKVRSLYSAKYNYAVFKQTASVAQVLKQCECDVVGVCVGEDKNTYYSVDVAFHEGGLNYKSKEETAAKIVAKMAKAAMCLYGCFNAVDGEIIFCSPKTTPAYLNAIIPCVEDLNTLFKEYGFRFTAKVITNEQFKMTILDPVLEKSKHIADTSELFVRSCQLLKMFYA